MNVLSEAGESETKDATPGAPSRERVLHVRTALRSPELRLTGAAGPATIALVAEGAGLFRASVPEGALRWSVFSAESGDSERAPLGNDFVLESDLREAWLSDGIVYDVDPRALSIDRVDVHTHPYRRTQSGFDFDGSALLRIEPAFGVDLAVVSYRDAPAMQRLGTLALATEHPFLQPIVWIDPRMDAVDEVDDLLSAGFRGLKFHPARAGYPADGPLVDDFVELCAQHLVPIQIHSAASDDNASVARIIALAKRFPRVPIIMVHTCLGQLDKGATLDLIAPYDNIFAETSWTGPSAICAALDRLGSERVLFGTDASTDGLEHFTRASIANERGEYVLSYEDVVQRVRECAPANELEDWSFRNAARLYRFRYAALVG